MNTKYRPSRILWEKTSKHTARILRIFGTVPTIDLPLQIAGCTVTEIGNYCFSKTCHLPDQYQIEIYAKEPDTELCGNYLTSVSFPESVIKIGDYAFYDCRSLTCITFGKKLTKIGSDAFMNCYKLNQLELKCAPSEKSGLFWILSQITWDVQVHFLDPLQKEHVYSVLFYPEYYEAFDEIAPAHIFGRKIVGEGFRARQSFQDGIVDYARYDSIFQKACAEESESTLCHIAFFRLCYPVGLSSEKKIQYETYIRAHGYILCKFLIKEQRLSPLLFLFRQKLLECKDTAYAISLAAQSGWSEGSASMLRWKQQFYPTSLHSRYELDDL